MTSQLRPALFDLPIAGLYPISMDEANALLVVWEHKLGPVHRPFTQQGFVLTLQGEPLAVATSGSTVSNTVAGYARGEVVELTRLARAPGAAWASRVMVRLWREVCALLWPDWPVKAAVSYSHIAMHRGDMYRTDGWTKVREDCGKSGGGGAWTRKRYSTDTAKGTKTLWLWEYPGAAGEASS